MSELIYYDEITQSLSKAIYHGDENLKNVPGLLKMVIEQGMWRKRWVSMTGQIVEFKRFEQFVSAQPPEGLGADIKMLQRLCYDKPEILDLIDQAVQTPDGVRQDTLAVDNVNSLQDRPTGNTSLVALRRLRKDRPDLHERVIAGELSPHRAMVEAGFRKRAVQIIPEDVDRTAQTLQRHLTKEQLDELISKLLASLHETDG